MKPRLLDLFSGAGGAATGYARAGFDVVGVDHVAQPNYPFEFVQADALDALRFLMETGWLAFGEPFNGPFVAIHASPPCQRYSTATKRNGTELSHPDLIGPTRELLEATGLPYVIENVVGSPLNLARKVTVCGTERGLFSDGYRLRRHRWFETNWNLGIKPRCACSYYRHIPVMDVSGGGPTHKPRTDGGGGRPYKGTADQARRIMGIDWMTKAELNEAVPPVYCEFIGTQLMSWLRAAGRVPDDFSPERTLDTSASPGRRTGSHPNTGVLADSGSYERSLPGASAVSGSNSPRSGQVRDARD